jgi:hypothetical protein
MSMLSPDLKYKHVTTETTVTARSPTGSEQQTMCMQDYQSQSGQDHVARRGGSPIMHHVTGWGRGGGGGCKITGGGAFSAERYSPMLACLCMC